jgi:hypothetical protein
MLAWMVVVALVASCRPDPVKAPAGQPERLSFDLREGRTDNHFVRAGDVAAHLLLTSGPAPRVIVAFPAGNSGVGMWLRTDREVALTLAGALEPVEQGGLRGVRATFTADTGALDASAVLSTIRVLRDYANDPRSLPAEIETAAEPGAPFRLHRIGLDGNRYELRLSVAGGQVSGEAGNLRLSGPAPLRVTIEAMTDHAPLGALPLAELLVDPTAGSERDRQALAFLTYREKMLAGSWRFLTYFGRDTLISLRLLLPSLRPAGIEGALAGVFDRLQADGQVAHEEDIGEMAGLHHVRAGRPPSDEPVFDYKMVDDNLLLAPVVAAYLLDRPDGQARADGFLARRTPAGTTYRDALLTNLRFVVAQAEPYAASGKATDLIALLPGLLVGDWRDSEDGLGRGRYAYSVNVALMPAALAAAARLGDLLGDPALAARAGELLAPWREVGRHFEVVVPAEQAKAQIAAYAAAEGLDPAAGQAAVAGELRFPALSLDDGGRPLPIMHSDDGFLLLFGEPDDAALRGVADRLRRPLPAGLATPVGMVIANGAFAEPALAGLFARDRYHGAVVWSWQQALMAAGLERQLGRADLAATTRQALVAAQRDLWRMIGATGEVRAAEHWSWQVVDGKVAVYRFGEGQDHESNAVQLWSTVYLAVRPPAGQAK